MQTTETDLRYPVGQYEPKPFSADQKEDWLADIKFLPQAIENAIHDLNEEQLQTPYAMEDGRYTNWYIMWRTVI